MGNVWSAEFRDLESIAEADTRHHSEKVAVLQMSEIATAKYQLITLPNNNNISKYQLINMYF